MNSEKIRACLFPDTVPGEQLLFPLVQVFPEVVHCQAVEDDEIPEELVSPLAAALADQGMVQVHVPAPLGEDRERFLILIRELKTRGGDYAAQLKALSLSGAAASLPGRSESRTSIIDTLLAGSGVQRRDARPQEMLLWQARLVLKLAEQFDAQQRALAEELERIRRREQGLLQELRQEEDDTFSLTRTLAETAVTVTGFDQLRLKAWSRLCCLGTDRLGGQVIFLASGRDSIDLACETHERLTGRAAKPLFSLALPQPGRQASGKTEKVERLLEKTMTLRRKLGDRRFLSAGWFRSQPQEAGHGAPDVHFLEQEWPTLLEDIYPQPEYGRCRLHLMRLDGTGPCTVFLESFGRDQDQQRPEHRQTGTDAALLGWLEPEETA